MVDADVNRDQPLAIDPQLHFGLAETISITRMEGLQDVHTNSRTLHSTGNSVF